LLVEVHLRGCRRYFAEFHTSAETNQNFVIPIKGEENMGQMKKVAVIMGSDSDFPVVSAAVKKLKSLEIPVEVHVISAHRTPEQAANFAKNAKTNGFGVIIAAAGMAAHLAGVLAAYTTLPVIGIPMKSATLEGLDALLATVQMPSGVPVATVAINGAENAAVLAAQILAVGDESLSEKLEQMKTQMKEKVAAKDAAIGAQAQQL
jgi:5-(carboxyamino)imidazole ribonucleotide mutase